MMAPSDDMDLDAMLKELGQFGKFQTVYFTMLLFPVLLCGFQSTEYIFTTMNIPHRCRIPECEGTTGDASFSTPWLTHAVPLNKDHEPENCLRYRPLSNNTVGLNTSCPADLFNLNVTQECQEWVFAESARSIAHDFNIMCPKDFWKLTILGSFSVMTSFVGLPLVGLISDRLGRKTVMVYGAVLICCVGIIRSFAVNYEMLASLEILNGLVTGTVYGPAFLLGLETLSPSKRLLGSMLVNVYFAMGEVVMGCYMWIVQDWRILLRFFYIPMLAVAALHWLLPESVRWLYTRGRYDDIEIIFNKIAKINKTENSLQNVLTDLRTPKPIDKNQVGKGEAQEPVKSLRLTAVFKSRIIMWRLFVCALCWVASIFAYYGISQNATYLSGGNRYATFLLVSLVEVPAYIASLWIPDWSFLGRRGTNAWSFFVAGVSCLALMFVSSAPDYQWLSLILFLVAKFASTMTITVIYLYTAEVFPTEVRHSLLSTCSMFGRIGSILSQQIRLVELYVDPNLVFGVVSLIGGVLALTCPETLGTKLPDTILEAEAIGRDVSQPTAEKQPQ
ncbi:solute carrier family 22 member 21-like isoform X1 [Homalodisca vitripennis]|uniref:solute carrier family 22 member 21-like isoform X1 n=2 Tax=Homalodisca vitripennis TaxID=197043 RepID=UPI001EEB81C2|nr:solute carrier family 22 member 21-like isoform X1 [Homalodisca vitripennis]